MNYYYYFFKGENNSHESAALTAWRHEYLKLYSRYFQLTSCSYSLAPNKSIFLLNTYVDRTFSSRKLGCHTHKKEMKGGGSYFEANVCLSFTMNSSFNVYRWSRCVFWKRRASLLMRTSVRLRVIQPCCCNAFQSIAEKAISFPPGRISSNRASRGIQWKTRTARKNKGPDNLCQICILSFFPWGLIWAGSVSIIFRFSR